MYYKFHSPYTPKIKLKAKYVPSFELKLGSRTTIETIDVETDKI